MDTSVDIDHKKLHEAFSAFNELSQQLSGSYGQLVEQVASLKRELAHARSQRTNEIAEKDHLAGQLTQLINHLPGGVVVLDGAGRVERCNPAALDFLGEPLQGEIWLAVIQRAFAPRSDDGGDVSLVDGRKLNISTCPLGERAGQVLLLQDVTEVRRQQTQYHRMQRLTAMGEMVASLAHQLRTPLASALLFVSSLTADTNSRTRQTAGRIKHSLKHLEKMINDMLGFARGGGCGSEEIDVMELLRELVASHKALLEDSEIRIELQITEPLTTIRGNSDVLLSALNNVLGNAVEAMGGRGVLRLSAGQNEERLHIRVQDSGQGIDQVYRDKIFEPFFTTKTRGTGLGLPIVAAVIGAHNGTIEVESSGPTGTCMHIELPAPRSCGGRAAGGASASNELTNNPSERAFCGDAR